jgi:Mn-dependent DtxR family transcriptional regulator
MMTDRLTRRAEDYLEAILILSASGEKVRISDIAAQLNVSKPSVVAAVRNLKEEGLVAQVRYEGVTLTAQGREVATQIHSRHESIMAFLMKILGVSQEAAEHDACKMEHFLQRETLDRMNQLVDLVENCPQAQPKWLGRFLDRC